MDDTDYLTTSGNSRIGASLESIALDIEQKRNAIAVDVAPEFFSGKLDEVLEHLSLNANVLSLISKDREFAMAQLDLLSSGYEAGDISALEEQQDALKRIDERVTRYVADAMYCLLVVCQHCDISLNEVSMCLDERCYE